jgi:RNase P subunit RPR2
MAKQKDEIARERIAILLALSVPEWKRDRALSRNYVRRATGIAKRFNTGFTREQRFMFCGKCFAPWIPSSTVDVSFDRMNKRVVYTCKECGHQRALKYK